MFVGASLQEGRGLAEKTKAKWTVLGTRIDDGDGAERDRQKNGVLPQSFKSGWGKF